MLKNEERILKAAEYFNNVSPSQFRREFFKQWLWFRSLINLILEHDILSEPKPSDTDQEKFTEEVIGLFTKEEAKDN